MDQNVKLPRFLYEILKAPVSFLLFRAFFFLEYAELESQ